MKFPAIDKNSVYQGVVDGIPGDVPGAFFSPAGVAVSLLDMPPTDEPGKWRDNGAAWKELTAEEYLALMKADFTAAIDTHMDTFAQTRGYDSMASAASYAGDEDAVFNLEGTYAKRMRSMIYRQAYAILDAVLAGERPMPTIEEVIAELPALEWPELEEEAETIFEMDDI